ncbi:glycerophosphodiester phosphodiesterase (plasmid) [Rhodobacteraceae bacterium SC52]|nr:glycerophosphodiester phosphodiesterase [Rhodobacteraceae bacterium SC52]
MTIVTDLRSGLHKAWSNLWAFFVVHLAIRLIVIAIIAPIATFLLGAAIETSDQSALTDQDIAMFLLTPWGFVATLTVVSLTICAAVLDMSVMTAILRDRARNGSVAAGAHRALNIGLHMVLNRASALFHFATLFVIRLLVLAAPFLAVAAGIAAFTLREYDINYYLTYMPPSFLVASGLIAVVLLALLAILLPRLSGWAIALHLVLFSDVAPRRAFAESTRLLKGYKTGVVIRLGAWTGARALAAAILSSLAGALVSAVPGLFGNHLATAAAVSLAILVAWATLGSVVSTLANGTLADMLDRLFTSVKPDVAQAPLPDGWRRTAGILPFAAFGIAAFGAISVGVFFADNLLDEVRADRDVLVIAHRGAAGSRPENTISSVNKALDDHADWVEIDVQETADGQVIVAHDSDFMKLGRNPLKVWDATMEDLADIDIGSWFDPAYADQRTPMLRDVLLAAKGRGKVLIELKYYGHDVNLEQRVADIVEETEMVQDVAIMSLKYPGIQKMRALRPDWRYGVLAATSIGNLSRLDADFLALNTGQISMQVLRRARDQGKQVYAWTVNDPVTMSRMLSMGIDGLITDEPALAREVILARDALSVPERLILWLTDRFRIGRFDLQVDGVDA